MNTKISLVVMLAIMAFSQRNFAQQQKPNNMNNKQIVLHFLNGFNVPSMMQVSIDLLAEDYKFTNPMVQLNSKAEFLELAKSIGEILTGIEILNVAENDSWVVVQYNFTSKIPKVETNTATEWFRIENGTIKESLLIYDASEWRKIYAQMENK